MNEILHFTFQVTKLGSTAPTRINIKYTYHFSSFLFVQLSSENQYTQTHAKYTLLSWNANIFRQKLLRRPFLFYFKNTRILNYSDEKLLFWRTSSSNFKVQWIYSFRIYTDIRLHQIIYGRLHYIIIWPHSAFLNRCRIWIQLPIKRPLKRK